MSEVLYAAAVIAGALIFVVGVVLLLERAERRFQREQLARDFQLYLTRHYLEEDANA